MSALDKDWVGLQWRGEWSAETQYRVRDAVQYQGSSYIAGGSTAPDVGEAPDDVGTSWELLASAGEGGGAGGGLVYEGEWNAETEYAAGDVVEHEGSGWVAVSVPEVGAEPGVDAGWELLVSKGATGATGAQGPQGATGATGATGPAGPAVPGHRFVRILSSGGGVAAGEVYLHQDPGNDEWSSVQYVWAAGLDADGYRTAWYSAAGELVGSVLTVSGKSDVGNPVWASWLIAEMEPDVGINIVVGDLVASQGSLGDLTDDISVYVLTLGDGSDIATPGTVGQVALFDGDGKLVGSPMLVVSGEGDVLDVGSVNESIIRIGNATTPTISIGPSGGGGSLTVHSSATFNGALLSPGTGSNSTKIGPSASAPFTDAIAIGRSASAGVSAVSIGTAVSGGGSRSVYIGHSSGGSGGNEQIAIGNGASASGSDSIALGRGVSAGHQSAVCIGRDTFSNAASSTATNDFVLGGAAHNYKFPGTIITDLRFRTTTGTKIGTATNQLIGFWNATPVDQPDNLAAAGADLGEVQTLANGIRSLLIEVGLMAPDP